MIITNSNQLLPTTPANVTLRPTPKVESEQTATNGQEQTVDSRKPTVRVIRVAPDGLQVESFGRREKSTLQQKPTEQYQANQELLQRDEVSSLLGIDLFA